MSNILDKIDIVNHDAERITRILSKHGIIPPVIEVFIELHDQNRALQNAVNDLVKQQKTMIEALSLFNKGFQLQGQKLNQIIKKHGDPNMDLISSEDFDG